MSKFTYENINTLWDPQYRETQDGDYIYWAVMKVVHNRNTRRPMGSNEQFGFGAIIDGADLPNLNAVDGETLAEVVKGCGINYPVSFAVELHIQGALYMFLHMSPPGADMYVVLSGSQVVAMEWV